MRAIVLLECLLEQMHIKLSSLVADMIGPSARRMLRAIASGETDPGAVVALGSRRLHATPGQLRDALGACIDLHPVYRRLLALTLDELEVIEHHIHQLDKELVYRRRVVRLGHAQAIGAIAHRLCRLTWKILHDGVTYEERGPAVTKHRAQRRAADDPRTSKSRLSRRTGATSRERFGLIARVFRPGCRC